MAGRSVFSNLSRAGATGGAGVSPAILLALATVALLACTTGCHNPGTVEVVALNFRSIDPPAPKVFEVKLDRCYWWTDEEGEVWVAMEQQKPVLLGAETFVFQMSLALEKLPAGRARNYMVTRRELRGLATFGPAHSRFVSIGGIVALYRNGEDELRGSFRLDVAKRAQGLLGGWTPESRYLMQGTFHALPDEERGRAIASETESNGWERDVEELRQPADATE
jgi:hypothetical protein